MWTLLLWSATIPMCAQSAAPRLSSRWKRSPLLPQKVPSLRKTKLHTHTHTERHFRIPPFHTHTHTHASGEKTHKRRTVCIQRAVSLSAGDAACSLWVCPVGGRAAAAFLLSLFLLSLFFSPPSQSTKQVPHWREVPKHDATRSWEEKSQQIKFPQEVNTWYTLLLRTEAAQIKLEWAAN